MKPYYCVIFSSELSGDDPAYAVAAEEMVRMAEQMPGFLGMDSYREGASGITVSYWESEEAIRAWKTDKRHLEVQARGRAEWYKRYTLRVARVERGSTFEA